MTIRSTPFIIACILSMAVVSPAHARSQPKCPAGIAFAELRATGTAHKSSEFILALISLSNSPLDKTYTVNFSAGADTKLGPTAAFSIAGLTFDDDSNLRNTHAGIVAVLNTPDIRWMRLDSIQPAGEPTVNCPSGSTFDITAELLKTDAVFDDRFLDPNAKPLVAHLDGLAITKVVYPEYPDIAYRQSVQGEADVILTVHRDGSMTDYRIFRTSGDPFLDGAALAAAKRTVISPARLPDLLGGGLVDAKYVIDYFWEISSE